MSMPKRSIAGDGSAAALDVGRCPPGRGRPGGRSIGAMTIEVEGYDDIVEVVAPTAPVLEPVLPLPPLLLLLLLLRLLFLLPISKCKS